jgi:hypothetical protein
VTEVYSGSDDSIVLWWDSHDDVAMWRTVSLQCLTSLCLSVPAAGPGGGAQAVVGVQGGVGSPIHNFGVTADCDARFGLELADTIAAARKTVCSTEGARDTPLPSSMECFPFQHKHKKNRDRPWDNFCVAKNFFIDFSKVSGTQMYVHSMQRAMGA